MSKKTTAIYRNIRMTMLKGKPRICPDCKGNGYLKTGMNTIVQCFTCWSEGEIDETIWARNYDPIIPDELQSIEKD